MTRGGDTKTSPTESCPIDGGAPIWNRSHKRFLHTRSGKQRQERSLLFGGVLGVKTVTLFSVLVLNLIPVGTKDTGDVWKFIVSLKSGYPSVSIHSKEKYGLYETDLT